MNLRTSLRRKVEQSCWKINNEKTLVVGLWKTSNIWGYNQPLAVSINLIENTKEMKNFFHQDDKEITWIIDKHHNSNIP